MTIQEENEQIERARKNPDCYDEQGGYIGPGADRYGSAQRVDEDGAELEYGAGEQKMTKETVVENIKAEVVEILKTGNSAQKLYLRVRPAGNVEVNEETNWCCSPDEYYKRVPHTLSLEILKGTRDYSGLSECEIEQCADNADKAADELLAGWDHEITAWIAAGNLAAFPKAVIARWNAKDWDDNRMVASVYRYEDADTREEIALTEDEANMYTWGQTEDNITGGSQVGRLSQ